LGRRLFFPAFGEAEAEERAEKGKESFIEKFERWVKADVKNWGGGSLLCTKEKERSYQQGKKKTHKEEGS